ncbi:MAG: hypothetical protein ACLFV7_07760 [Phycisphaerae bacterium]
MMTQLDPNNPGNGEILGEATPAPPSGAEKAKADLAEKVNKVGAANLMLAGLFVAGIVVLYLLSLRGNAEKAVAQQTTEEIRVSGALAKFSRRRDSAKSIVDSFYFDAAQRQIPRKMLSGDPFEAQERKEPEPVEIDPEMVVVQPETTSEKARALAAAKALRLQSILSGPQGDIAMIGNELIRLGDSVAGWKVTSIQPTRVVLQWEDLTHILVIKD